MRISVTRAPITLYGIRNCDTVKKARAWLDAKKIEHAFHDYKTAGIEAARLQRWCTELGWEALLNRAGTTFRKLINQKYPDLEIEHFHHAGNSSGVVDGAAAVLITSKDYAQKHGLKPRARIVATAAKLLEERGSGRALISICTAGGMGVVAILER